MDYQHELIVPSEGMPFKLFLFEGADGHYIRERHWHTSIEIFAVLDGKIDFYMGEEHTPLQAGELILINSNEVHSIRAPERNKTVVLQIPLKQFAGYFTAQQFIRFCSRHSTLDARLTALIRQLYQSYQGRKTGWEFKTLTLYYEILYILVNEYRVTQAAETEVRSSRQLHALSRITTYMREHYREELRLSELAARFGYSDAYLSRMFQKYANVNFKTYLQDIRMAYACRELLNTDHTISQIALDNGFCGSRSFAAEFRKRYGLLPSELRRDRKNSV